MPAPNQYGCTQILLGPQANDSKVLIDTYGAHGVDTEKLTNAPGAWVLSLRTLNIVPNSVVGNAVEVNSAIARILFGSGGQMLECRVNVFPDAVLQLPSATCRVELMWDPDLPAGYARPASVQVGAILQRTNSGRNCARRLTFLPLAIAAAATPPELDVTIPSFARGVSPWGDPQSSPGYSADLLWSFLTHPIGKSKVGTTGAGAVVTGQQLAAQRLQGREYEPPAGTQGVQGGFNGTTSFGPFPLTIPGVWALDWRIEL